MQQELTFYQANQKLKKQVKESRRLVADQLLGVSEVMGNFAKEIQRERENHHRQEELIHEAIQDFGIQIEHVEIYSLEQGNVDIDMTIPNYEGHGECEKIIAPMLSDILGETILVDPKNMQNIQMVFIMLLSVLQKPIRLKQELRMRQRMAALFQVIAIRRLRLAVVSMQLQLVMEWEMGRGPILKVRRHFSSCKKYSNQG